MSVSGSIRTWPSHHYLEIIRKLLLIVQLIVLRGLPLSAALEFLVTGSERSVLVLSQMESKNKFASCGICNMLKTVL